TWTPRPRGWRDWPGSGAREPGAEAVRPGNPGRGAGHRHHEAAAGVRRVPTGHRLRPPEDGTAPAPRGQVARRHGAADTGPGGGERAPALEGADVVGLVLSGAPAKTA